MTVRTIMPLPPPLPAAPADPGENEKNKLIAERLRRQIYRGVMGTTHFFIPEQAAIPYPDATKDPSLGMPHQYLQIQDFNKDPAIDCAAALRDGEVHHAAVDQGLIALG